ncbi:curlin subunit CsgB [Vibrio sp. T187]|uniref:curlin subunit CsgB n=1 Tax=Vibrio TaxID=662 RepID=UPI0010C9BAFE|nr:MULTISPECIES: curlin subunit CsgB [Vibrio]MBW3695477.1 curlin subunit CsgB [Vibrio sp. T187]
MVNIKGTLLSLPLIFSFAVMASENNPHNGSGSEIVMGGFGYGMSDLSAFNELEHNGTLQSGNYAEVIVDSSEYSRASINQYQNGALGNKAKIAQADSYDSDALIRQNGSGNIGLIVQTGTNNYAELNQFGDNHQAWLEQVGHNNVAVVTQSELLFQESSEISLHQSGDNNQAYLYDMGGSNYGISQNGNDSVLIVGAKNIGLYINQH